MLGSKLNARSIKEREATMTIIEILKIREITRGNPDCESNHINSRTKTSIQ